jgi:thermitase
MIFVLAALALSPSASNSPIQVDGSLCHPRRLLVKCDLGKARSIAAEAGAHQIQTFSEIGWAVIEAPVNRLQDTKRRLERNPWAERVEFDRVRRPAYTPNDPMWPDMWHMTAINVDQAWDLSFGHSSITVAVIDTGVDVAHEDLAANIWVNTDEIPGNNLDDDSNGYIDDVNGYDFAYDDPIPDDVFGHGSACAGLAAAVQDNNLGVTGVAPRAKIMALKAAIDSGYFYASADIAAFLYAANNGAKVLSMSFYGDGISAAEGDAINYCWDHGVLPVAAAGNDASSFPYYPGAYDRTLSVAAIGTNLNKAGFSNYGLWVDVAAPGTNLRTVSAGGGYTSGFGGTSGACPHVAGLAALLFGARLSATAPEVRAAIEDPATPVNQSPFGVYCNYGRINALASMNAILGTPAAQRPAEVRASSILGSQYQDVFYISEEFLTGRLMGRGFQGAPNLTISSGAGALPILAIERDWIEFEFPAPQFGNLTLKSGSQTIAQFLMPETYRACHPMIEGSTPGDGASVNGGFFQTLNPDAQILTCSRRNDGDIRLQASFKRLGQSSSHKLVIKRRYTGAGTERIKVYQWSAASYPYGPFIEVHTGPTPLISQQIEIPLSNSGQFIDFEGTVYVLIEAEGTPSGSRLELDMAHISSDF